MSFVKSEIFDPNEFIVSENFGFPDFEFSKNFEFVFRMLNEEPKTKKGIKNPLQRRQTEKEIPPQPKLPTRTEKKFATEKRGWSLSLFREREYQHLMIFVFQRKKWKLDEISRAFHRNQTFSFFFCSFSLDQNMSVTDDMSFFRFFFLPCS